MKGDGRYLMTLLRQFLTETAREVNLANGFTAEEIKSDGTSKVSDVKNFHLTFDRLLKARISGNMKKKLRY